MKGRTEGKSVVERGAVGTKFDNSIFLASPYPFPRFVMAAGGPLPSVSAGARHGFPSRRREVGFGLRGRNDRGPPVCPAVR